MSIVLDGTTGINTSGTLVATGSLTTSSNLTTGTGAIYNGIQSSTSVSTTSGTAIDFTNIPSWVKRITIMFNVVTTNSGLYVQLGYGSTPTYVNTGYAGSFAIAINGNQTGGGTYSAAFNIYSNTGICGIMTLALMGSNIWTSSHSVGYSNTGAMMGGGVLSLGNTLTAVRIAGGTFSNGSINILYE